MYPRPREKDSGEPKWLGKIEALITQQTSSMSTLTEQLTHYFEDIKGDSRDDASQPPPTKRPKPSAVPLQKSSPPCVSDSDDEFDKRYGHLYGSVSDDDEREVQDKNTSNILADCFGESEDENNNVDDESDGEERSDPSLMGPKWNTTS